MISYSAIKHSDLQDIKKNLPKMFPKMFPKLFDKLIPSYFQEKDKKDVEIVLNALMSCSIRTMKDKYLDKMLMAEVVSMTIPDKPTSRNQKYKLLSE